MKKISLLILLLILAAGCSSSTAKTTTAAPANVSLAAAKTTAEFNIDGIAGEDAWESAAETTVALGGDTGPEQKQIIIKAMYDRDRIYMLAVYKDTTPLKVGETWQFDGKTWRKGAYDDSLALVWNVDDSIKGFAEHGANVMTTKLTNGVDIYSFAIDPEISDYSSKEDTEQRADVWGWCGMPEFYGKGDDMFLAVNPGYAKTPQDVRPLIIVNHDARENQAPWIKNETGKPEGLPKFMYKPGLTQQTSPRPYLEDVVEITDYNVFKAGDRLPYVIGIKNAVWGGSKDDISVKGARSGDNWSVEFSRKLNTGNSDDINLAGGADASFILIIRDDSKGYVTSMPVTLNFK